MVVPILAGDECLGGARQSTAQCQLVGEIAHLGSHQAVDGPVTGVHLRVAYERVVFGDPPSPTKDRLETLTSYRLIREGRARA